MYVFTLPTTKQQKQYLEDGPPLKYDKETKRFACPRTGGVLPEPLAAKLFFGLVSGLQYLHAKRVCHRDIKVRLSVRCAARPSILFPFTPAPPLETPCTRSPRTSS